MEAANPSTHARLRERIPEVEAYSELGTEVFVVAPEQVPEALELVKDAGFVHLSDLSSVDWLPREPRYDVNYHLYSFEANSWIRVKTRTSGEVPSVVTVFPTADWQEREVFDFMGITFAGHPNLQRMFMPDEWIGHPLRKDYPVGGVPVEYRIEPAYVGDRIVSDESRASAGGIPARLASDRGKPSRWTWTGAPASGVRIPSKPEAPEDPDAASEGLNR